MPVQLFIILVTIFLLLGLYFLRRRVKSKKILLFEKGTWLIWLLMAFCLVYQGDIVRLSEGKTNFRYWNIFHYYLGAKYFDELGYFGLYSCALQANSENLAAGEAGTAFDDSAKVRDLKTYEIIPVQEVAQCPREKFTSPRWEEFKQDVSYLQQQEPELLSRVITDKGYNPTPFWSLIGRFLANRVSLVSGVGTKLLFNLDFLFISAAIILIGLVFGVQTAALSGIFFLVYFGTYLRLFGNFLQYLWLFLVVGGVCAWQKRRVGASAFCWATAGLLRIFPLLLLGEIAFKLIWKYLSRRHDEEKQRYLCFFWRLSFWLLLLLAISFVLSPKLFLWREFLQNIRLHSWYLGGELFNVGLRNLADTTAVANIYPDAAVYAEDAQNVFWRLRSFPGQKVGYFSLLGLLLILVFYKARRTSGTGLFILGLVAVYALAVLSPYYYLLLFIPLLYGRGRKRLFSQLSLFVFLAVQFLIHPGNYLNFTYIPHLYSELLVFLFLASYLVSFNQLITANR